MIKQRKSILAGVIGTTLEYYDFMLYMHFLFVLSPLFFPTADPFVSRLLGYFSFAMGYLMRPLGGIFFGRIGDKIGRKRALEIAILTASVPTFMISFLPTYVTLGILAPILLVLCRCLQSFSVAGEGVGAAVFLVEHANKNSKSMTSSLGAFANYLGGVLGTLTGFIFTQPFMPEWGWRIPFFLGGIFGLLGYYVRNKLLFETQEYLAVKRNNQTSQFPIFEALKKNKLSLLRVIGLSAGILAPFHLTYVYMADVLRNTLSLKTHELMLHNMILMFILMFVYLVVGWLGDKLGYKRVMSWSLLLLALVSYPMFELARNATNSNDILVMQLIISILGAGVGAPCCVFLSYLFPTKTRYSGYALSWQLGAMLFAGLSPLIAALLVRLTNNPSSPAIFLIFCGVLGLLSMYKAKQYNFSG